MDSYVVLDMPAFTCKSEVVMLQNYQPVLPGSACMHLYRLHAFLHHDDSIRAMLHCMIIAQGLLLEMWSLFLFYMCHQRYPCW